MRSPCLRLELLQYILGLDNRYSVAHVQRSVELAATCLNMSASTVNNNNPRTQSDTNHHLKALPPSELGRTKSTSSM